MRKSALLGSLLLLAAVTGCPKKKDDNKKADQGDEPAAKVSPDKGEAPSPVAKKPEAPPPRHKGVDPMPMPAAIALTADEQTQLADLVTKASSGVIQYGVPRGGVDDAAKPALLANPKLLVAMAQSPKRDVQVAAVQAMFDLQVYGDPTIDLSKTPEWKPVVFALMTGKDLEVAASATQSASIGPRDDKADPEIQKLLERMCLDEQRVPVRAAACAGVADHLNTKFLDDKDAQAVAAQALTDEEPYVVFRTLDHLQNLQLDAGYQDKVLPLLKSPEPAIRGLAVTVADRNVVHDNNEDLAAVAKVHDAALALLKDSSGYVRCNAMWALSGWHQRDRWDVVEPMIALLDDAATTSSEIKQVQLSLTDPASDSTWSEYASGNTVGECAVRALISKASGASENPLSFSDWDHIAETGRQAFTDWWTANKDKLLAPAPAPTN